MTRRTTVFLVLGLVVCAAVGLLCLLAPRWVTADESWQRAEQAMADHEFLRAQSYLVEYLVRWPQDARGHVLLARCYRQAEDEDLESAREHLKEAARLGGDNDELKLESALLDMQWHAGPPEVEQFLTSRMESQPADRPHILEALARGSLRQRRYNTANQWLDKWIHDDPDDWWPRMWRGVLFQQDGEWVVRLTGNQGSGVLRSMVEGNCFIILPEDGGDVSAGDRVEVQPFDGLV